MSDLDFYFSQTAFVVQHAYEGLTRIRGRYQEATSYWNLSRVGEPQTPQLKKDREKYLQLAGEYFGLKVSEGILAGSIIQVVHTALAQFSKKETIPDSCAGIPGINLGHAKFCIGQEVHGLPTGLIVYAARNQWAHWYEEELREPAQSIFGRLAAAYHHDPLWDLALDLSNPTIHVYSHEILFGVLRWTDYHRFQGGVRGIFPEHDPELDVA